MMTSLSLLLLLSAGAAPLAPLDSLRLAIVDVSPSMEGERLKAVRQELSALAHREPPSPARPIALVTFAEQARPARVFTSPDAFAAAVARLDVVAEGTRVATGLARAHEELQRRLRAGRVLILLYTDFEDPDQAGIAAAEAQLGNLFALRGQQGLPQQVFVKTWGSATAPLDARLGRLPHVELVDEYDLSLVPVTFQPTLAVTAIERLADPRHVRVTFTPTVAGRVPRLARPPALRFSCRNPMAEGDTEFIVSLGAKPTPRKVVLIATSVDEQAGQLALRFEVQLQSRAQRPSSTKPASTPLEVQIKLPPLRLRNRLTATLESAQPVAWHDLLQERACVRTILSIRVEPLDGATHVDRSTDFVVVPERGAALTAGKPQLHAPGAGEFRFPLELALEPERSGQTRTPLYCVRLAIKATNRRPNLVCEPPELRLASSPLPAPAPAVTQIAAVVVGVTKPRWLRIDDRAAIAARLEFDVRGPMPPGTRLSLIAPPGIQEIKLTPAELQSGRQQIELSAAGRLPVVTGPTTLSFLVAPLHSAVSSVRLDAPSSIDVPLSPLPTGRLVDLDSAVGPRRLIATAKDESLAILRLRPGLQNFPQTPLADALSARVESLNPRLTVPRTSLGLGRPAEVAFQLPVPLRPNFFTDVRQTFAARLCAERPSPAICASDVTIEVVQPARLKRLLANWSWPLSIAASLAVCGLVFHRLRQPL